MKKFLILCTMILASSAFANPYHHGHRNYGGSNWVAPLIGGVLIGAIISDARANQPVTQPPIIFQQPIYQPNTYNCLVQVYDPITRTVRNEVMLCVNK